MSVTEQHRSLSLFERPWYFVFRRPAASFRTKILVPLLFLMTLSTLGSIISFNSSTNTTRNRILDGQLNEDMRRLVDAFQLSEREVHDSAWLLANDPELIQALRQDTNRPEHTTVLDLDRRALPVRDRFRLDQVMVLNADGQPRVNIVTQSYLSQVMILDPGLLEACARTNQTALVSVGSDTAPSLLLMGCAPVSDASQHATPVFLGTTYTFLNLSAAVPRLQRELGLLSDIQLDSNGAIISTLGTPISMQPEHGRIQLIDGTSYRVHTTLLPLGEHMIQVELLRSEAESNAIVGSGLRAMFISNIITLVLLLITGMLVARHLTHPILQLAEVVRSVAAGDLSRRANLTQRDEVGQLGRAFDHATERITNLLDDQARTAGKFHAILQSIGDGVLAVDVDQHIVLINPAAARLLGLPYEVLLGASLETLLQVADPIMMVGHQQIIEQLRSELVDHDWLPTEDRVVLGKRVVRLQSAPTLGSGNMLTGAVVVIQDITSVVEADRLKSEFIATASHELRTPLTGIKGFLALFHMDGLDNLTQNQSIGLETITRQTDHLVSLVNDVLETARFDRGTTRAERRWVDVESSINEALTSLHPLMLARQVSVKFDLASDLAPIWIDGLHLRRILTNILSNAIKYVYCGIGCIHVRAYELCDTHQLPSSPGDQPWPHKDGHSVVIEVEDNGVGIKAEDQTRIFSRFFRSDNPLSIEVGGTGLGLSITQSLVHFHSGQIGYHSIEGQGSCFWVRLPSSSTEPIQMISHETLSEKEQGVV